MANIPNPVEYEYLTTYKGSNISVPKQLTPENKQKILQYYQNKQDKYDRRMELWAALKNAIASIPNAFKGKAPRPRNPGLGKDEFYKKGGKLD